VVTITGTVTCGPYDEAVHVVATPEVLDHVRERGGRLFVWMQKGG
jgi:hypothetical protein